MLKTLAAVLAATACFSAGPAFAWGNLGHELVVAEAMQILDAQSPSTAQAVQKILDTEQEPAFAGKPASYFGTWADWYRAHGGAASASWHYVDLLYGQPNQAQACFGVDQSSEPSPASSGPANDCVINKIRAFSRELAESSTPPDEKLLALKFLLHFIGDIHQPLHAIDRMEADKGRTDRGGNCVGLDLPGHKDPVRLHGYWDTNVVEDTFGKDLNAGVKSLDQAITPSLERAWQQGTPDDWARESHQLAVTYAYKDILAASPEQTAYQFAHDDYCGASNVYGLPTGYADQADKVAGSQIAKAAARLAWVLEQDFSGTSPF